jgi:hypothetical protein
MPDAAVRRMKAATLPLPPQNPLGDNLFGLEARTVASAPTRPAVVGVSIDSAYAATTSRFGLLARRNLIYWWPARAHRPGLARVVERSAAHDVGV